jgi:hypothetical protein
MSVPIAASFSIHSYLFPQESDCEMAATQLERDVIGLKTGVKVLSWILGILIPGLGFWGWFVTTNIIAMKQQLADGGNTKLVTELKNPQSPQQLQANLDTVIAQVETAKAAGQQPNPQKAHALAEAIAQVTRKNPDVPEAWQAATQLVNFRAPLGGAAPAKCFSGNLNKLLPPERIPPPDNRSGWEFLVVEESDGCTFDLDDAEAVVDRSKEMIDKATQLAAPERAGLAFRFRNAHIIYRGGPIPLEIKLYIFENCTFDWQLPSAPSVAGQRFTQQLLEANNPTDVRVTGG